MIEILGKPTITYHSSEWWLDVPAELALQAIRADPLNVKAFECASLRSDDKGMLYDVCRIQHTTLRQTNVA